MKNGRPEGEDAGVHSDLRLKHQTGDTGGRPSWRSSFLGAPGAKFFRGLVEKDGRSRDRGKVKIPMLYRDFQVTWESPALGLFHGPAFSTALGSTDSVSEP
jgi:hypothetical protein